jgi:hypothetical protein
MAVISTASSSPVLSTASKGGLRKEAIVGIVLGIVSVFLASATAVRLLYRRREATRQASVPQHRPSQVQREVDSGSQPNVDTSLYNFGSQLGSTIVPVDPAPIVPPQPSEGDSTSEPPTQNEKPVVVDEKRILGLDDASYLSRLPEQQGEQI